MALYSIDHLKRLKTGVILHYVPAGEGTEYDADTNIPELDKTTSTAPDWAVLAQTQEFTPSEETNDEEIIYTSAVTKGRKKETETTIDADNFEAVCIDWSIELQKLRFRTTGDVYAGEFVRTHTKTDPFTTAWLRIEHWSADSKLVMTEYKYAKIRVTTADPEAQTLVKPTISGQEIASIYNGAIFTAAAGAPVRPEPGPEPGE